MKIKVCSTEGVIDVGADTMTFHEHELVIDHWEAVFRDVHQRGLKDDAWLAERLAVVKSGRDRLYAGEIPCKPG